MTEQISTAGKEASGTGNMKFSMNGALTVGTLDGANIELRDEVGADNFFLFGLSTDAVAELTRQGYRPGDCVQASDELREVIALVRQGFFSRGDGELFRPLLDSLLHHDPYFVLADFASYAECQGRINEAYMDKEHWTHMSILNAARSSRFSSDRTVREYASEIWRVGPVPIELLSQQDMRARILQ